jgi:hypothetical protein
MTPEMRTTPRSTTGMAPSTRFEGRSPRMIQARMATMTTWVLPRTVASPAPTNSMVWCHTTRSTAKKIPAAAASQICPAGRGP